MLDIQPYHSESRGDSVTFHHYEYIQSRFRSWQGWDSGSLVMSDRHWVGLSEEHEEEESQQHPQPMTLPLIQVHHPSPQQPFPNTSSNVTTQLHVVGQPYPPTCIYPSIDPTLAAGYYHYGQAYGVGAFPFTQAQEHAQQQAVFSQSSFPFLGESSSSFAARSSHQFQRQKSHLGRTYSTPETLTPSHSSTTMSATLSAPASASYYPPPNGQFSHFLSSFESASSAIHQFMDPSHVGMQELMLQHSPTQSRPHSHSPDIGSGAIASQSLPLISPYAYGLPFLADVQRMQSTDDPFAFRDTSFLFAPPPPQSPMEGVSGQGAQAQPAAGQPQYICAVCGDTASCLHYGVRTCEGCKGFFKRTVQKNSKYVCLGNRDCIIDKRRRNRCQYCRFHKCLQVVVRTDSLKGRRGRLPSKSKMTSSTGEEAGPSGLGVMVVSQSLTKSLVNAYTGDGYGAPTASVRLGTTDQFIDSLRVSLQIVHQYAERLPDWSSIVDQDRIRLLKRFGVNTVSLRWAYRSFGVANDNKLITDDGLVFTLDNCPLAWQTWFRSVLALSIHLRDIVDIDLTAFSCLCALSLVFLDCAQLDRVEEVDKVKNNIINCLKEHCAYGQEAKDKPQYFSRILSILNDLNTIAAYARQAYTAHFGDPASLSDRPSASASVPLSLTFFDESFMD